MCRALQRHQNSVNAINLIEFELLKALLFDSPLSAAGNNNSAVGKRKSPSKYALEISIKSEPDHDGEPAIKKPKVAPAVEEEDNAARDAVAAAAAAASPGRGRKKEPRKDRSTEGGHKCYLDKRKTRWYEGSVMCFRVRGKSGTHTWDKKAHGRGRLTDDDWSFEGCFRYDLEHGIGIRTCGPDTTIENAVRTLTRVSWPARTHSTPRPRCRPQVVAHALQHTTHSGANLGLPHKHLSRKERLYASERRRGGGDILVRHDPRLGAVLPRTQPDV